MRSCVVSLRPKVWLKVQWNSSLSTVKSRKQRTESIYKSMYTITVTQQSDLLTPKCRFPWSSWPFLWWPFQPCISAILHRPPPARVFRQRLALRLETYVFPSNQRLAFNTVHITNNVQASDKQSLLSRTEDHIYTTSTQSEINATGTKKATICQKGRLVHGGLGKPTWRLEQSRRHRIHSPSRWFAHGERGENYIEHSCTLVDREGTPWTDGPFGCGDEIYTEQDLQKIYKRWQMNHPIEMWPGVKKSEWIAESWFAPFRAAKKSLFFSTDALHHH